MRKEIIALAAERGKGSHPGLVLQRYLCPVARDEDRPRERRSLLDDAIRAGQSDRLQLLYASAFKRWSSFPNDDLHLSAELRTEGRLIVGLGSDNVLETGIRLHHTYGVPIIPGSALKGLAAHYCNEVWGSDARFKRSSEKNYHRLLFGDTADGGVIVFHDAWITPESLRNAFCLDVMTPHHPGWQDEKNPKAPTDFDSPIPVSFLSVAGTFLVCVSWGGPRNAAAGQWTDLAIQLLHAALANWGVGGKTSSGYGRLEVANSSVNQPSRGATASEQPTRALVETGKVTVKVLEKRDLGGKVQYFVQEEGGKRGVLGYGTPPKEKLPEVGDAIEVYRMGSNPASPQYRWDKPQEQASRKPDARGGQSGRRPR